MNQEQFDKLKKLKKEIDDSMPNGLLRDKDGKIVPPIKYVNIVEAEKKYTFNLN